MLPKHHKLKMVPTHELQKGFYNTFSRQEISKRSIEPEERHNRTGNKSNNYLYCSPPVDVLICTNSPHSQSRRFIIVYDFLYIKDSTFRTPSVTGQGTSCTNGTTLFLVFCTYSTQLPIRGEIFIFRIENCSC